MATINCSYQDLGDTCRLSWQMCQHSQAKFADYKSKYQHVFINENLASIQSFLEMDTYQTLIRVAQDARQGFLKEKDDMINLFLFLKGYNTELEKDKTKLDTLNKDAGQQVFNTMDMKVWKNLDVLASTMLSYISKHAVELSNAGMPTSFVARIENKRVSLLAAFQLWELKDKDAKAATKSKNSVAQDLKTKLVAMLADAQLAFVDDKTTAKKFVWDAILKQVQGDKDTGIGGKIIDKATKKPLSNVTVTIASLGLSVVTDKDGKYSFMPVAAGIYPIEFVLNGFQTVTIDEKEVKDNVMGRLNVEMVAEVESI